MTERMAARAKEITDQTVASLGLDPAEVHAAAASIPVGEQRVFSPTELKTSRERHMQALAPFVPMHMFDAL